MTSPSELFLKLGAPLTNVQWSWGATHPDGTIFLRAWQDETRVVEGKRYIRLVNHQVYEADAGNLGYGERLQHLALIHNGSPGYVVICRAVEPNARPRAIKSFDQRQLIRLGEIRIFEGDEWGEMAERVNVSSLVPR